LSPIKAKKSLLRTLVNGVNLLRHEDGIVQLRITWRGGLVTETSLRLRIQSLRQTGLEKEIVARIQQLAEEGLANDAIAMRLNEEGFGPCRGVAFTEQIVLKWKARFGIEHKLAKVRRGNLPAGYTVREMARLINVDPSWIYRAISVGKIEVSRDSEYACYLFPRQDAAVEAMRELKDGASAVRSPSERCSEMDELRGTRKGNPLTAARNRGTQPMNQPTKLASSRPTPLAIHRCI